MTVKEVAELERVSPRMVQRYISEGYKGCKLPAVRVGSLFRLQRAITLRGGCCADSRNPNHSPRYRR